MGKRAKEMGKGRIAWQKTGAANLKLPAEESEIRNNERRIAWENWKASSKMK